MFWWWSWRSLSNTQVQNLPRVMNWVVRMTVEAIKYDSDPIQSIHSCPMEGVCHLLFIQILFLNLSVCMSAILSTIFKLCYLYNDECNYIWFYVLPLCVDMHKWLMMAVQSIHCNGVNVETVSKKSHLKLFSKWIIMTWWREINGQKQDKSDEKV